jgi:hypothetical protein
LIGATRKTKTNYKDKFKIKKMFKYEIEKRRRRKTKGNGKERGEMVKKKKTGLALQFKSTIKGLALQFI